MEFDTKTCEELAELINGGSLSEEDFGDALEAFNGKACDAVLLSGGGGNTPPIHP